MYYVLVNMKGSTIMYKITTVPVDRLLAYFFITPLITGKNRCSGEHRLKICKILIVRVWNRAFAACGAMIMSFSWQL